MINPELRSTALGIMYTLIFLINIWFGWLMWNQHGKPIRRRERVFQNLGYWVIFLIVIGSVTWYAMYLLFGYLHLAHQHWLSIGVVAVVVTIHIVMMLLAYFIDDIRRRIGEWMWL